MGNLSAVRQRTESIGFSPLRGSHRAARRQKYHYSVMALSYGEAVIHLPSTYRSFPQWEIIAFVTDVAHHHRNVTEECVLNFQRTIASYFRKIFSTNNSVHDTE